MTAPYRYPDHNAELGVDSPIAQQEWDIAQQRLKQSTQEMLTQAATYQAQQRLARELRLTAQGTPPTGPTTTDSVMAAASKPIAMAQISSDEYNHLLGAARFWQIPDAEKMDPTELKAKVDQYRSQIERAPVMTSPTEAAAPLLSFFGEAAGKTAEIAGGLANLGEKADKYLLPHGDTLAEIGVAEKFKAKMDDIARHMFAYSEFAQTGVAQGDLKATRFLQGAGNMAAYVIPADMIGGALGAVGETSTVAGRLSPFARAGIKMGTTGAILEGGQDKTPGQLGTDVAVWSGLGVFGEALAQGAARYGPTVGAALGKVRQNFSGAVDDILARVRGIIPTDYTVPKAPGTVDAEWSFAEDPSGGARPLIGGQAVTPYDGAPTPPAALLETGTERLNPPRYQGVAGDAAQGPAIPLGTGRAPVTTPDALPLGQSFTADEAATIRRLTGVDVAPAGPPEGIEARRRMAAGLQQIDRGALMGSAVAKEATIFDSPLLDQQVQKPSLSDGDVAQAALAANPGGTTVIKSVGDPAAVVEASNGQSTFVQNPQGGVDALVGDLPDGVREQYQRFGLMTGQRVYTPRGMEVTVHNIDSNGMATVKRSDGPPIRINYRKLTSTRYAAPPVNALDEWQNFRSDLLGTAKRQAEAVGAMPVESIADPRVSSMIQHRLEDYFNAKQASPGTRQVLQNYFEQKWADEFRSLRPEDNFVSAMADQNAGAALEESEARDDLPPLPLEERAETKGFTWISAPGKGGQFIDNVTGGQGALNPTFETDAEAESFIANVDRTLPDLTPVGSVPAEVGRQGAGATTSGTALEPKFHTLEHQMDAMADAADAIDAFDNQVWDEVRREGAPGSTGPMENEAATNPLAGLHELYTSLVEGGGGGGRPPIPPDTRGFGDFSSYPPNRPALGGQTLGEQLRDLIRDHPDDYALFRQRYIDGMLQKWRPTRYRFLALENAMQNLPRLSAARPFDQIDDLYTATTRAHNEAQPWHETFTRIMRDVPRQFNRTGDWARVHELQNDWDREQVWGAIQKKYGWNDTKMAQVRDADARLTDAIHRFAIYKGADPASAFTMEREIFRYIPHIRAQQAQGIANPFGDPQLNPVIQDFAEYVRAGNMQMRNMDMRELMYHMVNATFTKKHLAEPWENLVNTWQQPDVPKELQELVLGYGRLARYGHDMDYSAAVQGVKGIFRGLGLPVSTREAATIINTPLKWSYQSFLAGRPSLLFRDALQPLKSALKVGPARVLNVYRRALASQEYRAEIHQRAIAGGWAELDRPQMEMAGLFEGQMGSSGDVQLTAAQAARREFLARIGDRVVDARNAVPSAIRDNLAKVGPLKLYARLSGDINRTIAGEVGWETARDAIAEYRAWERVGANSSLPNTGDVPRMSMQELMDKSRANSYESPIRQKFAEMIALGADDEAASFLGRQMSDWSQGRYGTKENMAVNRGFTGKLIFQLGNFAPQELESVISMARNGSDSARVGALLGYAGIAAALSYAEHKTGWGFSKWIWAKGIAFGGGPLLEGIQIGANVAAATMNEAGGQGGVSPMQTAAIKQVQNADPSSLPSRFFPLRGYAQTADQLYQAMSMPDALNQAARYIVTGDKVGNRADFRRQLDTAQRGAGNPSVPAQVPVGALSPNGGAPNYTAELLTPANGVQDQSLITRNKFGNPVYSTNRATADGRVPTHRLDVPSGRRQDETWEQYEDRVNAKHLWEFSPSDFTTDTSLQSLDEPVRVGAQVMMQEAAKQGVHLEVHETYRPQSRQEYLFKLGRSVPGTSPATWTLTSNHADRRALDFRVNGDDSGTDPGYQWLQQNAPYYGFDVLGMQDPGHVQMPVGPGMARNYAVPLPTGAMQMVAGRGAFQ